MNRKFFPFLVFLLLIVSTLLSQPIRNATDSAEIVLSRDSLRLLFGTYQFAPAFKMNIFSVNEKVFAQRVGDEERFQIFPRRTNLFFLKAMPAELEFLASAPGNFDTLILHQGGKDIKANRILAKPYELYDTILHLDSLVYDAYNNRQLKVFMSYFSPNLEFYHDLTGKTDYKNNLERFTANFSGQKVMRRALLKSSVEIYPIEGFGAIEIGTHQFFETAEGAVGKLVSQPKFIHIWQRLGTRWHIVRIISYDH